MFSSLDVVGVVINEVDYHRFLEVDIEDKWYVYTYGNFKFHLIILCFLEIYNNNIYTLSFLLMLRGKKMKVKIWDQHRLDYMQMKDKIDDPTKAFVVVFASFFG